MDSVYLRKESMKDKDFTRSPKAATHTDTVVPITPEAITENGDFQSQSPLTLSVVRKQLNLACIDCDCDSEIHRVNDDGIGIGNRNIGGSPGTPKDGVFDPFAPGPDHMARPLDTSKYVDECRTAVARRLDFHPSDVAQADTLSDEDMIESVYETLLQVIVSNQAEGDLAPSSNRCESPPSVFRLAGIADTCPGAPMKPVAKPRNIVLEFRKKLEF